MSTIKSLCRWLAPQASLSGHDPYLHSDGNGVEGGEESGVTAEATPEASASWGSRLNITSVLPPEEDVLELDYGVDEDDASDLLT